NSCTRSSAVWDRQTHLSIVARTASAGPARSRSRGKGHNPAASFRCRVACPRLHSPCTPSPARRCCERSLRRGRRGYCGSKTEKSLERLVGNELTSPRCHLHKG